MELLDNLKKKQDTGLWKFILKYEKDKDEAEIVCDELGALIDQFRSETAETVARETAEKILNLLFPSENENDIRARKIYMESFNSLKK